MENLRGDCKLDSKNALPTVLAALVTDPRRLGCNKARRTIAVVVVVMRKMKQKISRLGDVLPSMSRRSDLLEDVSYFGREFAEPTVRSTCSDITPRQATTSLKLRWCSFG